MQDGYTALMIACNNNHRNMIMELIGHGADIHQGNRWNETPIKLAARTCDVEVVETLLVRGANVHQACEYGQTPLMVACLSQRLDNIRCLLKYNANPYLANPVRHCRSMDFCNDSLFLVTSQQLLEKYTRANMLRNRQAIDPSRF
eukprot:TRINITY_DN7451_c0_g2_i1.p1 TRINITY_DN7451_c0_g2~~TRINITY_DN7451_c0_g2_i1.p1  ORF type:complete len:145 (+),score=3.43 TRINITY_DN7451_c0_g2_i1:111-545(+)